jgi:ATP-dependent RNA helicase DDX56/DBP9
MFAGIDFKNVAAVVNFDMPTSASSYTHRIGRTARAGRAGIALSFVIPKELFGKHKPTSIKSSEKDEKVLAKVTRQQAKLNRKLEPYNFNKSQMEAFRYRMNDGMFIGPITARVGFLTSVQRSVPSPKWLSARPGQENCVRSS